MPSSKRNWQDFSATRNTAPPDNTGNSRNGSYQRTIVTSYGKITVDVPRDHNGEFQSTLLPARKQRVDSLETTIIQLYQRGVTTRQIAELIEQMYGHYYTPATISKITADVSDQVEQFHSRPIAKRYPVIFCDAMYVNLRRDSVAKEAIHVPSRMVLSVSRTRYKASSHVPNTRAAGVILCVR